MTKLFHVLVVAALCGAGSGCSRAANVSARASSTPTDPNTPVAVVPVGKGSFASNVPPEVKDVVKDIPTRELYLVDNNRPIPTNQWWTNLLVDKYAGRLWTFPHQVEANQDGINLTFPIAGMMKDATRSASSRFHCAAKILNQLMRAPKRGATGH